MAAGNFGSFSLMEPLSTKKSRRDRNMKESSRVSYMTEVMEPQIWKSFPEDLFEHVLARLPIATIIRFRVVCQQWNNLITSQGFSQHSCVQVSQAIPWFYITFEDNYRVMYDPFEERWYYDPNIFGIPILPVSSAGGLVCFFDFYYRDLYVCNSLTQCFKKLPAGSIKRWGRLGMTVNGIEGYKVLRLDDYNREYEIYDSVTKNWGHLAKVPECINRPGYISYNPVSIDDMLYFMQTRPTGIVSCNTSTGVWTQHLIQAPLYSSNLELAESGGQIMLVGLLTENNVTCVCIWKVQKVTFLLKEVDRRQFSEFRGKSVSLACLGNKGLLLCYLTSNNMYYMVTYNVATRKWVKVCLPHGREPHAENRVLMHGTAFQPCLTAMP
ncbi:F-box only protein 6-like isoform X1 [Trifolium pratense]|uniref:F-box only protein 6-like isoform X1 n=2 Tax=Trifolium pratense TaxID=57577 RepID=UPI001E68FECB|nr:F-box only protein 6-like isoform X1 [Trifolium pratense]